MLPPILLTSLQVDPVLLLFSRFHTVYNISTIQETYATAFARYT